MLAYLANDAGGSFLAAGTVVCFVAESCVDGSETFAEIEPVPSSWSVGLELANAGMTSLAATGISENLLGMTEISFPNKLDLFINSAARRPVSEANCTRPVH